MRTVLLLGLGFGLGIGCGFSKDNPDVDAGSGSQGSDGSGGSGSGIDAAFDPGSPIAGGGISSASGPIAGALAIYVVDAYTDAPIANAMVFVAGRGPLATDATGLVVITDAALTGAQTVGAKMAGYRNELWAGVAGARVTIPLQPSTGDPPGGSLAITSGNLTTPPAMAGNHANRRITTTVVSGPESQLISGFGGMISGAKSCMPLAANSTCNFTMTARTGPVAVFATEIDTNLNGGGPQDDQDGFITWQYGMATVSTTTTTTLALTTIDPTTLVDTSVNFNGVPGGLGVQYAYFGLDVPNAGYSLFGNTFNALTPPKLPPLSLVAGSSYKALAIAADSGSNATKGSYRIVGGTTATLTADSWLAVPTGATIMKTQLTWTPPAGETYQVLQWDELEIMVFDHSGSVALSNDFALPGNDTGNLYADRGAAFDVANFGFAADGAKIDTVSGLVVKTNP